MLRWCDRRWRAAALQRKSCEGVDQHRNAEQDQNHAEPSDKLEIEERRLQTPSRNPPRHDTGDCCGGNQKKDRRPQNCQASGHDVAPASQIPACASWRDGERVVSIFIDRGAPAPTLRRRLTHANNYLIVESRRPCESVSTKPTVQHIGHPRSATRAATPAPKDSQGCAVWWTMAQASSAAAAAPRIRCAPRKALPNMPTPRK